MPDRPAAGSFVASLDARSRQALERLGTVRRYRPGTVLFWEGERSDHVAVVLAGTVKCEAGSGGAASLLALRGPGDLVGELTALDATVRSASAIALGPVTARLIPQRDFEHFLATSPGAAMTLLLQVVHKLRDSDRRRIELGNSGVPGRLARCLVQLAEDHGQPGPPGAPGDAGSVRITVPLTQQDLAAMIGASREAVARSLHSLRRSGYVTTKRRELLVLDLDGLRRRAG